MAYTPRKRETQGSDEPNVDSMAIGKAVAKIQGVEVDSRERGTQATLVVRLKGEVKGAEVRKRIVGMDEVELAAGKVKCQP